MKHDDVAATLNRIDEALKARDIILAMAFLIAARFMVEAYERRCERSG